MFADALCPMFMITRFHGLKYRNGADQGVFIGRTNFEMGLPTYDLAKISENPHEIDLLKSAIAKL